MSESYLKTSPQFDSTSIPKFDGFEELTAAFADGIAPEPELSVWEWADENRQLTSLSSPEPGRWKTDRVPFAREIMDCLSVHHPAEKVVFMKGSQVSGTECGLNWIGYSIAHSPGPMLYVLPDLDVARKVSKQRIAPMIAANKSLRAKVSDSTDRGSDNAAGNTMLQKNFPGGMLIMIGAKSEAALRSMPIRRVFLDEVDGYDDEAEGAGDPIFLAEQRTKNFGRKKKIFIVSTPLEAGTSHIEAEFEASDQRKYHVPCPRCMEKQELIFVNLKWTWGSPETAHYICKECSEPIFEWHKTKMLDGGEWIADRPGSKIAGFHLSSLYSPVGWMSWAEIATAWEGAQGKPAKLKTFTNQILGLPYAEREEAPEWENIFRSREHYPAQIVPNGAFVLTAGVDVQKNRLEVSVWGWGRRRESWLVDHQVFEGDPDDGGVWGELEVYLAQSFETESGKTLALAGIAVDSSDKTNTVYSWVLKMRDKRIYAIKGASDFHAPETHSKTQAPNRKRKRRITLWTLGVSKLKSQFYRDLKQIPTEDNPYPAGVVHLTDAVADQEFVEQLTAESVRKDKKGKLSWGKDRERNEALDCRIYARAAAIIEGIDSWKEDTWAAYERAFAPAPGSVKGKAPKPRDPAPVPSPAVAARSLGQPIRQVRRSPFMSR
jgi:phage terminase large subunit GpA-like protein